MTSSRGQGSGMVDRRLARGARWFYIIAALTAINCVLQATQWPTKFAVGLTFTEYFDTLLATVDGGALAPIGYVFDAATIGIILLLGYYASQGHAWTFVVGGVLYAMDTFLFFVTTSLLGVIFLSLVGLAIHGLALYYFFRGFLACRDARLIREAETEAAAGRGAHS
jgi:hypothetical protein